MLMPFEWVVGDSSKDHTVTASMFYDVLATVRYTTLRGITNAPSAARIGHAAEGACQAGAETEYCDHGAPVLNRNNAGAQKTKYSSTLFPEPSTN